MWFWPLFSAIADSIGKESERIWGTDETDASRPTVDMFANLAVQNDFCYRESKPFIPDPLDVA